MLIGQLIAIEYYLLAFGSLNYCVVVVMAIQIKSMLQLYLFKHKSKDIVFKCVVNLFHKYTEDNGFYDFPYN